MFGLGTSYVDLVRHNGHGVLYLIISTARSFFSNAKIDFA